MNPFFTVSDTVRIALANHKPVVALESTIISHGMPYPQNVETALLVEETVRSSGAIPATVAIIDGVLTAGINKEQIELLGKTGQNVTKASRRDLPILMAKKAIGATTVASTMIAAKMAGIKVFATGGIGGVHRGAEVTMDISADLEELAQTDVCVVCAGPKSILDIGLTLEFLETKGVPVLGYQTDELPAFYCRKSGFMVDARMNTPKDIAQCIFAQSAAGLSGGILVANPIPEKDALPEDMMNELIIKAVHMADELGIQRKALTPYLLETITNLTEGKSLASNIQLVLNNAVLAAQIASAYCEIKP